MSTEQNITGVTVGQSDQSLSDIDKAVALTAARKAKKASETTGEVAAVTTTADTKTKRVAKTPEERAAALAKIESERIERKAKKVAARAEKLATTASVKPAAHMKKVDKAAERLGTLNEDAQLIFTDATTNLGPAALADLVLHLQHFGRAKATERALDQKLTVGQKVTITGGDPRFIGKTGTVAKSARIRCYVTLDGAASDAKPAYCFTSEVEPLALSESEDAPEETSDESVAA